MVLATSGWEGSELGSQVPRTYTVACGVLLPAPAHSAANHIASTLHHVASTHAFLLLQFTIAPHPSPPPDWCTAAIPALDRSFRLTVPPASLAALLARAATGAPPPVGAAAAGLPGAWEEERMPVKRNQGAGVLLPNGQVLLLSGNEVG